MTAIPLRRRRGLSPLARREARWALIFLSPWIIGFFAFLLVPMVATFLFTFTNINLNQAEPLRFVGLDNYAKVLHDQQTWESLGVTLKFAAFALPVAVILPFLVALLLSSRHLKAAGLFRILFFMPYVVPFVAGVLIWQSMLNPDSGWIDLVLKSLRDRRPAQLAPGPDVRSTRASCSSACGASAAGSSSTSPASRASRASCTTRPGSTAPAGGRACAT